ncbi:protein of unknown function (DUF928) [Synechococcus sp. PCC 7502]|nr:protein of unknown function (DUF928) [Synechococcus sp. PCC 7502]
MIAKPLLVSSLLLAVLLAPSLESSANPSQFQRFFYKPRTGMGIPQNSLGGTTRSDSCKSNCPIVLVPADTIPLTASAKPSFLFYVPSMKEGKALFQLFDQQDDKVFQTTFDLTATGGIVQFNLPNDAPNLETGKNYQWRVVIRNTEGTNELKGFVRRVSLSAKVNSQPQTAETYAQEGIWLDMLKTLVDDKAPEATVQMRELLKSVKFEAIANQPLLKCCKPIN